MVVDGQGKPNNTSEGETVVCPPDVLPSFSFRGVRPARQRAPEARQRVSN